jgi:hypothetical protein
MFDLLLLPLVMLLGHDRQPVRERADVALRVYVWLADSESVLSTGLVSDDLEIKRRCERIQRCHRNFNPYFGLGYPKLENLKRWAADPDYLRLEQRRLEMPYLNHDPGYTCLTRDFAHDIYRKTGKYSSRYVRLHLTSVRVKELLKWSEPSSYP